MKDKDKYWKKAKKEGYRARSAYKLKQINERFNIIKRGDRVLDIGAAPGGWLQVAKELTGEEGLVLGVDKQKISKIKDVKTIKGDINNKETLEKIKSINEEFDVLISDVSPDLSGNWTIDHAKSIDLSRRTLDLSKKLLNSKGRYLVKVFKGEMYQDFYKEVESSFEFTKAHSPDASRDQSAEIYIIGKNIKKTPIKEGETYKVKIIDEGKQGDGLTKINDFVVFIPKSKIGEKILINIKEIKDRYAIGEKVRELKD